MGDSALERCLDQSASCLDACWPQPTEGTISMERLSKGSPKKSWQSPTLASSAIAILRFFSGRTNQRTPEVNALTRCQRAEDTTPPPAPLQERSTCTWSLTLMTTRDGKSQLINTSSRRFSS